MTTLSPVAARRVYLTLTATRWFPVGLVLGAFTLLARERGLSVQEITVYAAAQGVAVLLLELPTSGFADVLGRRPVLLAAGVVNIVAGLAYLFAQSFWQFALAAGLMGVYRALDSGPLQAWYVDAAHASDPDADVHAALSAEGVVTGVALGTGSLVYGGLVAWHPVASASALVLPVQVFVALSVLHLVVTTLLLRETPRTTGRVAERLGRSVRETPRVVRDGFALVRSSRVLAGLVLLEVFWVVAMAGQEQLFTLHLAEVLGSEERAGAWMGPAGAAAWALFSAGSWLAGRLVPRLGAVRTSILARVLHGLGIVGVGLALGPVGVVTAYLAAYTIHGLGGPPYLDLVHREANASNRATVLSFCSLAMQVGGAVSGPLLGILASRTSLGTAIVVAGATSVLGVVCLLPALRAARVEVAVH
jgi:predicted MFS family arabinose efflux permease